MMALDRPRGPLAQDRKNFEKKKKPGVDDWKIMNRGTSAFF
jgi:hypothetical protein